MSKLSSIFACATPTPIAEGKFKELAKGYSGYLGLKKFDTSEFSEVFDVPTLVGIEVEVENISKELSLPHFWFQEQDGSLRNHGAEFKSIPLTPEQAFTAVSILWHVLNKTASPDFSWRTSIHFHFDAMMMEEEEFKRLLMLSLVFEHLMFQMVGQDREQNPYCAPLTRSNLTDHIGKYLSGKGTLKMLQKTWNSGGSEQGKGLYKYSSVNLARLSDLGTIEFRHLGGTKDTELVLRWLELLLKMYKAAISMDYKSLRTQILQLNTTGQYMAFVKEVFGKKIAKEFPSEVEVGTLLMHNITAVKEMLLTKPKFEKGCSKGSALFDYAETVHKRRVESKREVAKKPVKK